MIENLVIIGLFLALCSTVAIVTVFLAVWILEAVSK